MRICGKLLSSLFPRTIGAMVCHGGIFDWQRRFCQQMHFTNSSFLFLFMEALSMIMLPHLINGTR
jgi:hypothetical protein